MSSYYQDQLSIIDQKGKVTVQFFDETRKTHNLDLNLESIPIIIEFLNHLYLGKNINIDEKILELIVTIVARYGELGSDKLIPFIHNWLEKNIKIEVVK